MATGKTSVDWDRIDKPKLATYGLGGFATLFTAIYPISVIKTRMMALGDGKAPSTTAVVRSLVAKEGIRGLYRGYPTVLCGVLPMPLLQFSCLEISKKHASRFLSATTSLDATSVDVYSSTLAGGCTSLASQAVQVPIEVVSQQQQVSASRDGAMTRLRTIVANHGVRGLYRGYLASLSVQLPTSCLFWGNYSLFKPLIWNALPKWDGDGASEATAPSQSAPVSKVLATQALAAAASLCATSICICPLDVVRVRVQTAEATSGRTAGVWEVFRELIRTEGLRGLYRGVAPRTASMVITGTTFIVGYEHLKRVCVKDEDADAVRQHGGVGAAM